MAQVKSVYQQTLGKETGKEKEKRQTDARCNMITLSIIVSIKYVSFYCLFQPSTRNFQTLLFLIRNLQKYAQCLLQDMLNSWFSFAEKQEHFYCFSGKSRTRSSAKSSVMDSQFAMAKLDSLTAFLLTAFTLNSLLSQITVMLHCSSFRIRIRCFTDLILVSSVKVLKGLKNIFSVLNLVSASKFYCAIEVYVF